MSNSLWLNRFSFITLLIMVLNDLNAQKRDDMFAIDTFLFVHRVLIEAGKSKPYTGLFVEKFPNRKLKYRVMLDRDRPNGLYEEWFENSVLHCQLNFDNQGREHGVFQTWDVRGNKKTIGHFNCGLKDSLWLFYGRDTVVMKKGTYKKGLKQGEFSYYTRDGLFYATEYYRNDTLVSTKTYFDYELNEGE